MEAALDAGAEDIITNDDGSIEVITAPDDFLRSRKRWKRPASSQRWAKSR